MAYATYTTEALVCGSKDSYTSDRSYLLFTREAGMLWASARSVREERSKQRYALQDFSIIRVSLVRGKTGWRIGSVESIENTYTKATDRATRGAVTRLVRLLRQFVHGEEVQLRFYDDMMAALRHLVGSDEDPNVVADIATLRALHHLGYISQTPEFSSYLGEAWLDTVMPLNAKAERAIEQAYQASHL